jgi:hypothetical protein
VWLERCFLCDLKESGVKAPHSKGAMMSAANLFFRRDSAKSNGVLFLVGGILAIAFAVISFISLLFIRVDQFAMHAVTTLPTLMGIAGVSAGLAALRSPSQVSVDDEGLVVFGKKTSRRIRWCEVGLAAASEAPLNQRRRIKIFDVRGKLLVTIPDTFTEFETLVGLVQQNVNQHAASVAEPLRMRKARRMALLTASFGVFMAAAGIGVAYDTWSTERGKVFLEQDGVPGEGKILRRFLAPNGVNCRVEYQVTGENGQTAKHNVEVDPEYWDELEDETSVPILYVPNKPWISRLANGEIRSRQELGKFGGYGLAGAASFMTLFMLAASVMQWYGWDYGTDPKTGKLGFRKIGT